MIKRAGVAVAAFGAALGMAVALFAGALGAAADTAHAGPKAPSPSPSPGVVQGQGGLPTCC